MIDLARRYAATTNNTIRACACEGADKIRVTVDSCAPRYCILRISNVTNPANIAALQQQISMAIGKHASSIKFGYPLNGVPNTAYLEVPYDEFIGFSLANLIQSLTRNSEFLDGFFKQRDVIVPLGFGQHPAFFNFSRESHLLISGSTGSGKSVLVRSIINYLLGYCWNTSLILVDPKSVEFADYERMMATTNIPGGDPSILELLSGVNAHKRIRTVFETLGEIMDFRYDCYARAGTRNIAEFVRTQMDVPDCAPVVYSKMFSTWTEKFLNGDISDRVLPVVGKAWSAMKGSTAAEQSSIRSPKSKLLANRIVVVIDELADLIMTVDDKHERNRLIGSMVRIAQKGRAAGVHLILATQRPSKEVLPGLLKANLPTRIALRSASYIDSMLIIDRRGAENLSGAGDALFAKAGSSLQRFQAPNVDKTDDTVAELSSVAGVPIGYLSFLKNLAEESDGHFLDTFSRVNSGKDCAS